VTFAIQEQPAIVQLVPKVQRAIQRFNCSRRSPSTTARDFADQQNLPPKCIPPASSANATRASVWCGRRPSAWSRKWQN